MTISQTKHTAGGTAGRTPAAVLLGAAIATSALGFLHPAFFVGTMVVLVLSCVRVRKTHSTDRVLTIAALVVCTFVLIVAIVATSAILMASSNP